MWRTKRDQASDLYAAAVAVETDGTRANAMRGVVLLIGPAIRAIRRKLFRAPSPTTCLGCKDIHASTWHPFFCALLRESAMWRDSECIRRPTSFVGAVDHHRLRHKACSSSGRTTEGQLPFYFFCAEQKKR